MEKITDHSEIIRKLNAYLGTNLSDEEAASTEGFKKIATALRKKQCNNSHLDFLEIDLVAFEELVNKNDCHEIVFGSISPVVNDFLAKLPKEVSPVTNQYNPLDFDPNDHCARELPAYG